MSQALNAGRDTLREAFYVLSTTQDVPDAKLLDDVVRRYPQFGDELTDFAIAIAIDGLRGDRAVEAAEAAFDPETVSPAVSRAMSHFQNRLYSLVGGADGPRAASAGAKGAPAPNPFAALDRGEFHALAKRLGANTVFVSRLRDRQIDPATMTPDFQCRVAEELKAPLDVVVAHFAAQQSLPSRQFFKADAKPSIGGRQTFEEAVRTSGLSESQQRKLLGL
jgi:hypothetical protein